MSDDGAPDRSDAGDADDGPDDGERPPAEDDSRHADEESLHPADESPNEAKESPPEDLAAEQPADAPRGTTDAPEANTDAPGTVGRLDPLSIPYRAIAGSLNLGTVIFLVTIVASGSIDPQSSGFVFLLGGGILLSLLYQWAYYQRFEYKVTADTFDISSGVLSRRQREIPLRRIQNVDLSQNPIQRSLGIAAVRVETAGGGETEAVLRYVSPTEARRLQRVLRGARERATTADTSDEQDADTVAGIQRADDGDREVIFELSRRNLALLSLFTFDPGAGVISSVIAAVATSGQPNEITLVREAVEVLPGGRYQSVVAGLIVFVVAAWVLSIVLTFARYYDFRLLRADDDLEYERGLFQQYSGTIPTDKIQTVTLRENLLKRRFGYASLAVETAGYAPNQSSGGGSQKAVPLAPRDRTIEIAQSIEPVDGVSVESIPKRSRTRYGARWVLAVTLVAAVVYAIAVWQDALAVDDSRALLLLSPVVLAPVVAHYMWVHRGYRTTDNYFLARVGFWRRSTRIVPYYRIQTIADTRSIFQRRRDLASVTADTASSSSLVGGAPTAIDIDDGDAADLGEYLRRRLQESLRAQRRRTAPRYVALSGDADTGSESESDPTRSTGDEAPSVDDIDWIGATGGDQSAPDESPNDPDSLDGGEWIDWDDVESVDGGEWIDWDDVESVDGGQDGDGDDSHQRE